MLGKIIGLVNGAFAPVNKELALAHAITDPVVSHVHGLGALLLDGVVGDAGCGAIVRLNRGWRLGVAQFLETRSKWASFFAIVKKCPEFSLGDAGDDFS